MSTIEVEKKFVLTAEGEQRLIADATPLAEKRISDAYYDTADFRLTTSDRWLRNRDGRWELKVPVPGNGADEYGMDQYRELTDEADIRGALNIPQEGTLENGLTTHGYRLFAQYVTVRREYRKGPFTIDVDETDFGFREVEVELMVEKEEEVTEATARVIAFAREHGLDLAPLDGKTVEYIRRHNPAQYNALSRAGILRHSQQHQ